ncbi:SigE family RNA polymerase sigma factor [Actinoplanes sp. NBC_00393]|uniref:SigE family RNA polymerase sigma factor n=1 Tax=Actinoplanes sp. NBC_00393 TaxID=2975953 RepID=UPI002E201B5C
MSGATFTRFFQDSGRHLVRLAYLLVGDLADAEDVAQEVLEELYRRWADIREDTAMAYARTAVVNRSRSMLRRRAVARRFAPFLAEREQTAAAPLEDRWLWDLVQELPRRQREVVVLRYWCDLGEAEIARVLGVSAGTVKSSASRARARLAAAFTGVLDSPKGAQ